MLPTATNLDVKAQTPATIPTDQRLMMNTITSGILRDMTEAAPPRTTIDIHSQRSILLTATNLAIPLRMVGKPIRAGLIMAIVLRQRMTTWATDMMRSLSAEAACGMTRRKTGPRSCGEEGTSFSKLSKLIPWSDVTESEIVLIRACCAYQLLSCSKS
jgi:hypothetical protein